MNIEEAQDIVLKGKEMPVGTVSNGYKKVAKGKWVKVSDDKKQKADKLNIATLPVVEARKYAEAEFKKAGKDLNKVLPNFDKNYQSIQNACKNATDVPRSEMPVITQKQIDKYKEKLSENKIKYAEGKISAKYLKPTQSQIWLNKIVKNIIKFGPPSKNNSTVLDQVTISSSDNKLADGHHRYGQTMLSDPNLGINSLKVDLPIKKLLKDSKSFGESQGNVSRT